MFHLSDPGTSDLIFWRLELCSPRFSVYAFENAFTQLDFSLVIQ
jgi:hypothetical protein